ncbi:MAG: helix-turn-helix domain-containing protein, partial [Syntrophaceae bacterium]|nr:helix-turn-helix domain-containing protein [Syntrophaceae bacterium]
MAGPNRETVGQYLRRERESRSVSLQELSKNTRINVTFLEALERDDFGALPRQEFIPGFLQGYARQLGLKAEEVLRRYRIQVEWAGRKEKFQQIPLFPG